MTSALKLLFDYKWERLKRANHKCGRYSVLRYVLLGSIESMPMKHALSLLLLSCAFVAQGQTNSDDPGLILRRAALGLDQPNRTPVTLDEKLKMATELKRLLREGRITQADIDRMFKEGKIDSSVMLMMNVEDDAAPTSQSKTLENTTKPVAIEKDALSTPKIPSVNVRDELIVEVHALKEQIAQCRQRLASNRSYLGNQAMQAAANNSYFEQARVQHESNITLLIESQRALLLALAELTKESAKDLPTEVRHSSNPRLRR